MGNKSETIKVKVTEETKKQVSEMADNEGLSLSSWTRTKIRQHLPQKVEA